MVSASNRDVIRTECTDDREQYGYVDDSIITDAVHPNHLQDARTRRADKEAAELYRTLFPDQPRGLIEYPEPIESSLKQGQPAVLHTHPLPEGHPSQCVHLIEPMFGSYECGLETAISSIAKTYLNIFKLLWNVTEDIKIIPPGLSNANEYRKAHTGICHYLVPTF